MHPLDYVLQFTEVCIMYYLWLGEGLAGTHSSERNNAIGRDPLLGYVRLG
jgi:hypothetical protein